MSNRTKFTAKKEAEFVERLAVLGNVSLVCQELGISRRSAYDHRAASEEFKKSWDDAIAQYTEKLEAEADRRAVEGTLKPVFYQGSEVGHIREYSDTLLMFRLKALAPDRYRERHELTGKDGEPLFKVYEGIDPERV